jgi:hypothetical protein
MYFCNSLTGQVFTHFGVFTFCFQMEFVLQKILLCETIAARGVRSGYTNDINDFDVLELQFS